MDKDTRKILNGIKDESREMLYLVYNDFFPWVENYVKNTGGSIHDAQDVFQDAMVVIFVNSRKDNFEIRFSFETYLYSISKYIWYKGIKRKKKKIRLDDFQKDIADSNIDIADDYTKMEKRKLVLDQFMLLKPDCQRLLRLFYDKTPISRITKLMNFSSDQYTKNRRNHCKGELIKAVWKNPRYKELKNESYRENSEIPRW